MSAPLIRLNFLAHITASLSWTGAVAVFLALAIRGLHAADNQTAGAFYLAMELTAFTIILPLCISALVTGIIQAVISGRGLFTYYWVTVKLFLTLAATIALIFHLQPIKQIAELSGRSGFTLSSASSLRIQMIADSAAAILILLLITTISVFKPWGKWKAASITAKLRKKSPVFYILIALSVLLVIIIISHITGGGMSHH